MKAEGTRNYYGVIYDNRKSIYGKPLFEKLASPKIKKEEAKIESFLKITRLRKFLPFLARRNIKKGITQNHKARFLFIKNQPFVTQLSKSMNC